MVFMLNINCVQVFVYDLLNFSQRCDKIGLNNKCKVNHYLKRVLLKYQCFFIKLFSSYFV